MKFLHLNFIPRSADFGLLVLRLWFGLAMALLHGWGKFTGFSQMAAKFPDPLHVGNTTSAALTVFGELVCSLLIAFGLFTRAAALVGIITMGVAFFMVHQHKLSGEGNGELAYAYLGVFVTLFLAGAGKFSVDAKIGAKG